MNTLKKIGTFYLLSIDAVIRLMGACLITGLLAAALALAMNSVNGL